MGLLIAGIGTDVGKTVVSAILIQALGADYWKPVSSGAPSDRKIISQLIDRCDIVLHKETYQFPDPLSPHSAAKKASIFIDPSTIKHPMTTRPLLIEMAGGALVPLTQNTLLLDALQPLCKKVLLVSQHYLGSINHTLLTVDALRSRNMQIEGLIFNGKPNPDTEEFILHYTGLACLGRLLAEPEINPETIKRYAIQWKATLLQLI